MFDAHISEMRELIQSGHWEEVDDRYFDLTSKLAGSDIAEKIRAIDLSEYRRLLATSMQTAVDKARSIGAKAVYFEYDRDNDWSSHFFLCSEYRPEGTEDDDSADSHGYSDNEWSGHVFLSSESYPEEAEDEDWVDRDYYRDNHWNRHLIFCGEAYPAEGENENWVYSHDDREIVRGPSLPEFAEACRTDARDLYKTPATVAVLLYLYARTVSAFGQESKRIENLDLPLCIESEAGPMRVFASSE
ncbi:unnamed protein product [marine sediment metagenome]|uniref:Uncharacterized protein n=1 Tax=marine sediment metagenome TaxID=412755 RepID=X0SII2_9ZZZZ